MVVVHHSGKNGSADLKCASCGSLELVDGKCQSTGLLYFVPEKSKFWTLKTSTVPLKSKMCKNCGYILLKGNTDHLSEILESEGENDDR